MVREWWCHVPTSFWFIAERNTVTDEILKTYPAGELFKDRVNFAAKAEKQVMAGMNRLPAPFGALDRPQQADRLHLRRQAASKASTATPSPARCWRTARP